MFCSKSSFQVFAVVFLAAVDVIRGASTKIVGGAEAKEGEFPYIVSLRVKDKHICGGSIINENYILTAAHCVHGQNASVYSVVAGTNQLDSGGDSYSVEKLIAHSLYCPSFISNDIALMKLKEPIKYNEKVQPIELYTAKAEAGSQLILAGWGTTSYPGTPPNKLQTLSLTMVSNDDCSKKHPYAEIKEYNLCTFNQEGEGACHGDSGGPLAYEKKQIGVVSWGKPCAKGVPDVFTRVAFYMDWLNKTMAS